MTRWSVTFIFPIHCVGQGCGAILLRDKEAACKKSPVMSHWRSLRRSEAAPPRSSLGSAGNKKTRLASERDSGLFPDRD
jgi:hypothetical protein